MEISPYLLEYLLVINIVTIIAFGADKISARSGTWRTRERTLLVLALLGGSPGALAAIHLFRHKSGKSYFLIILGVIFLMQLAFVLAMLT